MLEQVVHRLHSKTFSSFENASTLHSVLYGGSSALLHDTYILVCIGLIIILATDQIDAVANYTQKGIDHLEKFGVFLKERAIIEEDYAAKLRLI
ncbi:unnamed protein product [Enterobius vermicularis]|uniref:FCH domain-containing protein n=1 Tax=Enterobius vermicularis TaxID=51028 RepID=A0A0N4VLI8_ENTVE|nr:unnamed protein product [Enterobius vermicularis]